MFKNAVLKKMLGPTKEEELGTGKNCVVKTFVISTHLRILLG